MLRYPWRFAVMAVVVGSCASPSRDFQPPAPDPIMFEDAVYPVLLTDCAFSGCHGAIDRFFRVHGPGRPRLDPATLPYAPPTADELALSYTRAASMLVDDDGPRRGLLPRKPLAVRAGGERHGGDDRWGQNVYATKQDPRWQVLYFWALTAEQGAP